MSSRDKNGIVRGLDWNLLQGQFFCWIEVKINWIKFLTEKLWHNLNVSIVPIFCYPCFCQVFLHSLGW